MDVLNSLKISIFNYYLINCDQLSEIKTPKKIPKLIKVLLKQSRGKKCHKKFYSEYKKVLDKNFASTWLFFRTFLVMEIKIFPKIFYVILINLTTKRYCIEIFHGPLFELYAYVSKKLSCCC